MHSNFLRLQIALNIPIPSYIKKIKLPHDDLMYQRLRWGSNLMQLHLANLLFTLSPSNDHYNTLSPSKVLKHLAYQLAHAWASFVLDSTEVRLGVHISA